jgi:hypothetical protein
MIFIPIVLFNLLNALAISDTHEILKVAEVVEIQKRISTLEGYERLFSFFKSSQLNIFPKTRSILVTPNQNKKMKFEKPKTSKQSKISFHKIKKPNVKKVKATNQQKFTFDHKFVQKILDYVKRKSLSQNDELSKFQDLINAQQELNKKFEIVLESLKEFQVNFKPKQSKIET